MINVNKNSFSVLTQWRKFSDFSTFFGKKLYQRLEFLFRE